MNNGTPKPLEDAAWVAKRFGLPEKSGKLRVYELARTRVIPSVRIGRSIKFDPNAVEAWIAGGGNSEREE